MTVQRNRRVARHTPVGLADEEGMGLRDASVGDTFRDLEGAIRRSVRRRVPSSEVDDIVQSAFVDAVASKEAPEDETAFRRWLAGIVRHKVADFHRRRHREEALDSAPDVGHVPSHEERDLLRWATRQLPDGAIDATRTLEWMLDEADGEKLEHIAERERVPATRVRKRVHRLRAFFRARWREELVVAALLSLIGAIWVTRPSREPVAFDPVPEHVAKGRILRSAAERACASADWAQCERELDRAMELDGAGERGPLAQKLRADIASGRERSRPPPVVDVPNPEASPAPPASERRPPPAVPTSAPKTSKAPDFAPTKGSHTKPLSKPGPVSGSL